MCSAEVDEGSLACLYHCHSGRLVVTNGVRLGARSARGGLVYLPTILQTTVSPEEEVVLEVPHEEVGKEALHDMVHSSFNSSRSTPTGSGSPRLSEGDH